MFQNQYGALAQALQRAGLSKESAAEISKILSNPQQTLRTGPIEQDLTPRNMRQVTRDDRLTLPGFDQRDDDPYYQQKRSRETEERDAPTVQQAVSVQAAPQQRDDAAGTKPGAFLDTTTDGDAAKIGLRLTGDEGGVVTANFPDNSLRARSIRAESDAGNLRFSIEEYGAEIVWKLMFVPQLGTAIDVVTDVRLGAGGLEVSKARIFPLRWQEIPPSVIPVEECE